jgi:hypothetical protein
MARITAVAVLALVASCASAKNPKEKSAKAVRNYGCEICPGRIVKIDAVAFRYCMNSDGVVDPNVTKSECLRDNSNSWLARTCGEEAQDFLEVVSANGAFCKSSQDDFAASCCSDAGGGGANTPSPTSKPTGGPFGGAGPGDDGNGNGTVSESHAYAIDACFNRRALHLRDVVFSQVQADWRAPARLNGKTLIMPSLMRRPSRPSRTSGIQL